MSTTVDSRFQNVVLLHDRGDDPNGQVAELARILTESHPNVHFLRPHVPMQLATAEANFNLASVKLLPMLQPNALVIGIGLGGLFAVAMQERFPALNVSVFAINSPGVQDGLETSEDTGGGQWAERVALYSSQYEPSIRSASLWLQYADYAFDVPWLAGGVQKAMYATSYVISAFMRGLDLPKEVASMFPQKDQAQTEAAGI